jgi:hypothetical protein
MFGQGPFMGVLGVGVLWLGGVLGLVGVVGVELLGAAAAPATATAAPPTASVPETIATLSVLEMCMSFSLRWWMRTAAHRLVLCIIMRAEAKRARRLSVGAV